MAGHRETEKTQSCSPEADSLAGDVGHGHQSSQDKAEGNTYLRKDLKNGLLGGALGHHGSSSEKVSISAARGLPGGIWTRND